jgi:hypothetical protein
VTFCKTSTFSRTLQDVIPLSRPLLIAAPITSHRQYVTRFLAQTRANPDESDPDSLTSNPKSRPPIPMLDPFHPQGGLRSCEYSINAHCLTLERVVYEVPLVFLDNYALFNTHHGTETRRSRSTRRAMKMHLIEASRHE